MQCSWLMYFTQHNVSQVHPYYCKWYDFFLPFLWIMLQWMWVFRQSLQLLISILLDKIARTGIASSYGRCSSHFFKGTVILFSLVDFIILHSYQQWTRVLVSPHPQQCLIVFFCNDHPNRYEVIPPCGFDLHFSMVKNGKLFLLRLGFSLLPFLFSGPSQSN